MGSRRSSVIFWAAIVLTAAATPAILIWWPVKHPPAGVEATGATKTAGTTPTVSTTTGSRQSHKPSPVAKKSSPKPATHTRIKLSITASRGPSWVLVRRQSTKGRVLYSGTLAQGHSVALAGPKLYAQFGAVSNLDVEVGRVSVDLRCYPSQGVLLTQDGAFPKPSQSCLQTLGS